MKRTFSLLFDFCCSLQTDLKPLGKKLIHTVIISSLMLFGGARFAAAATAGDASNHYPSKPITVVVGYTPGGATDIITRLIASKLERVLGQPVIVENRPGAGSNIATDRVVRAQPDGYTLLVETIANATNMSVYKNMHYDTRKDLAPIVQFMASPSVLVVNPSVPAKNLKEFIALAKAKPGKLTYASSGVGGSPHLAGEMVKLRAGISMVHVPYKGATPALTDVIGGTVSCGFMTSLGALQYMQNGKLRPIAVASPKRLSELPNVPTMAEAGLPNFDVLSWNGLAAPAGTPEPIIQRLNKEVNKILKMPDVKKQLEALGAEPVGGTSAQFSEFVNAEIEKWGVVVKTAGISLD